LKGRKWEFEEDDIDIIFKKRNNGMKRGIGDKRQMIFGTIDKKIIEMIFLKKRIPLIFYR
jgi:hypothetical protein